ncbi:MAG: 50S ribosomal protein L35 [Candidatus Hodgkinia cicadicola]
MFKLKTKSGAKKRFKRVASGEFKASCACRRHRLCRRPKTAKQQLRKFWVGGSDEPKVRRMLAC